MKMLVVSAVVLGILSTAGAQQACRLPGQLDTGRLIGSMVGALVGSAIGDGRGQTLATGVGAMVGGLIGNAASPGRQAAARRHTLVKQLNVQGNQVIDAALSGRIPMPRKAAPVHGRSQALSLP